MSGSYVIALDQGTTSSRAVLIDRQGRTMTRIELCGVDNPRVQVVIDGVRYVPAPPYIEDCEVLD